MGPSVALQLDPADRPVASSVDHVEIACATIAEQERVGVPEIESTLPHRKRSRWNVHLGLGNDRRMVDRLGFPGRWREHGVASLDGVGDRLSVRFAVAILSASYGAELLLDPVRRLIEGTWASAAPAPPLENDTRGTWAMMSQVKL